MALEIKNLEFRIENKEIIHDLSLTIKPGEVHALMGPNGSGKSSLAMSVIGNRGPVTGEGKIILDHIDISNLKPDERARAGLFLAWQYPREIEGVEVGTFLKAIYENKEKEVSRKPARHASQGEAGGKKGEYRPLLMSEFTEIVEGLMGKLQMDKKILQRDLNHGFSGGEKKKLEILQMLLLEPKYAILDEIDSGLDIDALKVISAGINTFRNPERGLLLITHYNRLLKLVKPNWVHVMMDGRIIKSGGPELAHQIEITGYK